MSTARPANSPSTYAMLATPVSPGNTYFEGRIWQNIERGSPRALQERNGIKSDRADGHAAGVAAGVVFVASPVASRISGTNLIIDGALTKAV